MSHVTVLCHLVKPSWRRDASGFYPKLAMSRPMWPQSVCLPSGHLPSVWWDKPMLFVLWRGQGSRLSSQRFYLVIWNFEKSYSLVNAVNSLVPPGQSPWSAEVIFQNLKSAIPLREIITKFFRANNTELCLKSSHLKLFNLKQCKICKAKDGEI